LSSTGGTDAPFMSSTPKSVPPILQRPRPPRQLWLGVLAGALATALLLCALAAYAVLQSRAQYEERAGLLTDNLAAAVERSVSANIEKVDLAISSIADHMERQLAGGRLDPAAATAHIRSQAASRPELEGIRVTDARGTFILGPTVDKVPGLSFADREWFIVQRENADAGLHASAPLRSKLAGLWIISFSRRYRAPDGSFAGAISAAVPLSYLTRELATVNAGDHGAVTLRDSRLRLIARHAPAEPERVGQVGTQQVSPALRAAVVTQRTQTRYVDAGGDGEVERVATVRRLGVVPLLLTVELSSRDYLNDWYGEVRGVAAMCAGIVLVYAIGAWVLLRLLTQNRRAQQRIEMLAKVFEGSRESIMLTDREHRIIEVNPAFTAQTGYLPEEVVGREPEFLYAERTPQAERAELERAVRESGQWWGEVWDRAKNGRVFPKWLSISTLRDADGVVTHHIASAIDVTDMKQAQAHILHLAHHDTLTQLPNRVQLQERLVAAMAQAGRDGGELAMLFIDMDRFKNINDTLGHQVGDGLLVEVGQRLRQLVRVTDIVARLGGDEFVLVLTNVGSSGAAAATAVAGKLIQELGRPYRVGGHELHSTPSIGIGIFPRDGTDTDTLMRNADTAMYGAKAAGRNTFQFFAPAMNLASQERLALEVGLRGAIERGELLLHYQPQVDLASGRVVGLEALVRWQHPERGAIPPLKFIPIAEDTGQIETIGAWVLEQALAQVGRWRRDGHADLRVAVNLSAQQLRGDTFTPFVAQALLRHGLPGQALELEITESVAMQDPARTAALLRELRGYGVALAIDDFGTGYSSLAYLKQLPLSCLKLDRSFVMDIEKDPNDAAICTATIQMAHSLGLAVVAEGVETAAQLAFLRGLGCDMVQGYHISRPMPSEDCSRFLQDAARPARPALVA